mgnify:CR=1 FL=1
MLVSELEKNAERTIKRASIINRKLVWASFKGLPQELGKGFSLADESLELHHRASLVGQQEFTDQFTAKICQCQQQKAGQCQADRIAAATAAEIPAPEQNAEYHPGYA